jgi:hypothetical protein
LAPETTATEDARPDLRYEVKIVCHADAYPSVRAHLDLCDEVVRRLHPTRRVQSVYLDTHDGDALEENLAGVSRRAKLRVRWYGTAARGVRAVLERKVRVNTLGWKDLWRLPEPIDVAGADRHAFMAALRGAADARWAERLSGELGPAQWVAYTREYLATADRRVRITLDTDLWLCDQRARARLDARFPTPIPRLLIVELKAPEDAYDAVQALMHRFPAPQGKSSKFVLASSPGESAVASLLGG